MNRVLKSGMIACALVAFAASSVKAEETAAAEATATDEESVGWTPVALGLATPVQIPWSFDWDVFGLDLNLFYSDCNLMYGWELSAGANTARRDLIGLQTAPLFNLANRESIGSQISLFNMSNRKFIGFTADAVGITRDFVGFKADLLGGACGSDFYGLQAAIAANAVREDMYGLQVAPGANFARKVYGAQFAMAFNMTSELHGAQIGLVNYAATCPFGFQIGLVNLIMDNQVPFLPIVNAYF